jgi:hypothetical protein
MWISKGTDTKNIKRCLTKGLTDFVSYVKAPDGLNLYNRYPGQYGNPSKCYEDTVERMPISIKKEFVFQFQKVRRAA